MNKIINTINKALNGNLFKELSEWLKENVKYFSNIISIEVFSETWRELVFDEFEIFEINFRIKPDFKNDYKENNDCLCKIEFRRNLEYIRIDFKSEEGLYRGTVYSEKDLFKRIEELLNEYLEYLKEK